MSFLHASAWLARRFGIASAPGRAARAMALSLPQSRKTKRREKLGAKGR
jgi:hypothetical protein